MSLPRNTWLAAAVIAATLAGSASAEDLATTVASRLRDSGALAGYRVNVKAKSGTVWLEGRVADEKQLTAAVGIAESSPGVERVVNRLAVDKPPTARSSAFGLPSSVKSLVGPGAASKPGTFALAGGGQGGNQGAVQLVQGTAPVGRGSAGARPLPMAVNGARPARAGGVNPAITRTAMRNPGGEPMTLPGPGGYEGPLVDGQMVPGTMRYSEGAVGEAPMPGGGYAGGPMPMGNTGVGMPPVPMRADGPNMPNYAWPSYAAHPNYAAVQYPTQYSPTAWPYIGPFYPYPQVPLGWRRVSLEWDDGWWWLDFDERHIHSHHR